MLCTSSAIRERTATYVGTTTTGSLSKTGKSESVEREIRDGKIMYAQAEQCEIGDSLFRTSTPNGTVRAFDSFEKFDYEIKENSHGFNETEICSSFKLRTAYLIFKKLIAFGRVRLDIYRNRKIFNIFHIKRDR